MQTLKELYEAVLLEVRKEGVPSFHLREFNHYVNNAINQVVDDALVAFETTQRSLDYLKRLKRVYKATMSDFTAGFYPESISFALPNDYKQLTNLIITYKVNSTFFDDCYNTGDLIRYGSKRLDSDT